MTSAVRSCPIATFNSAAFVFFGIVALAIPGALLGLVMRFDWGLAVVGVLWPLILLGAVVLAILGIGLAAADYAPTGSSRTISSSSVASTLCLRSR